MKLITLFLSLYLVAAHGDVPAPKVGDTVSVQKVNGETVSGKIIFVDREAVTLLNSDGGAKLSFLSLSQADQDRFGYSQKDKDADIAAENALKAQALVNQQNRKQQQRIQGQAEADANAEQAKMIAYYKGQFIFYGEIFQIVRDKKDPGMLVTWEGPGELVFIKNISPAGLQTEQNIKAYLVPCSTNYTYYNLTGDQKVVQEFEMVPEQYQLSDLRDPHPGTPKTHFTDDDVRTRLTNQ